MLTRTEGIVLKTRKYGEADLIVTYLTPDRGMINAFAKSPRKTKSRFGSSLEPLTHAKLSFWGKEQTSMPKITQSDIINSFYQLRENYRDFVNISKFSEILISLTPEGLPNKKLFLFMLNILHHIRDAEQDKKDALYLMAQIRLLAVIGYAPGLKSCGRCGDSSLNFYPDAGTTLCTRCTSGTDSRYGKPFMKIDNKVIHFYTHSIEWPLKLAGRLKPDKQTMTSLNTLLDKHLDYLLSKKLMTAGFVAESGRRT